MCAFKKPKDRDAADLLFDLLSGLTRGNEELVKELGRRIDRSSLSDEETKGLEAQPGLEEGPKE